MALLLGGCLGGPQTDPPLAPPPGANPAGAAPAPPLDPRPTGVPFPAPVADAGVDGSLDAGVGAPGDGGMLQDAQLDASDAEIDAR